MTASVGTLGFVAGLILMALSAAFAAAPTTQDVLSPGITGGAGITILEADKLLRLRRNSSRRRRETRCGRFPCRSYRQLGSGRFSCHPDACRRRLSPARLASCRNPWQRLRRSVQGLRWSAP